VTKLLLDRDCNAKERKISFVMLPWMMPEALPPSFSTKFPEMKDKAKLVRRQTKPAQIRGSRYLPREATNIRARLSMDVPSDQATSSGR
jgi:hypothetical protein